jgi:hypothetical protein
MDTRKKRSRIFSYLKYIRPWCTGNTFGGHTMIEYHSKGTKECADCQYQEPIIIKVD